MELIQCQDARRAKLKRSLLNESKIKCELLWDMWDKSTSLIIVCVCGFVGGDRIYYQ